VTERARKNRVLTRRNFLWGLGGSAVALPLLSSLRAGAAGETFPKRLVLMYAPNGEMTDAFWPQNVVDESTFDLNLVHQPLAAYKNRLLLLDGVDLAVTDLQDAPGGLHQKGIGGLYTGQMLQSGDLFVDGCGQRAGWANGISVDQQVAKTIAQGTPFTSLELGVRANAEDVQGRIAYAGPGAALPPMNNPDDVFNRLFSNFQPGGGQVDPMTAQRRSVLDTVQSQFRLLSPRLSVSDQQKVQAHLDLVRDIETRLGTTGNGSSSCQLPVAPPTFTDSTDDMTVPNTVDSEDTMPQIAELQLDLLAAAFACDLTRVATYQISTSLNHIRYPWVNSLGEGHALSHAGDSDTDAHDQLVRRHTWHNQMLANFLDRLAQIPEGSGTVLDSTLVVMCSEVSVGNTHSHKRMPLLVVGGGWYFRTGRYLKYTDAPHNNLLVSILNAMGDNSTSFGLPSVCTGPLDNLV
jgi:hypothetical protein